MPQEVSAVIAREKNAPVEVTTIVVPDPGPGEAVVAVQACGVCHTDLHYREGGISDEYPFLLGHEAAGVVEAVGDGVTDVAPGDFVVLNWRAVCGKCRACARGRPWYCFDTENAAQRMTLLDGTELTPALGIGAFAEKTLVASGQCTKVDPRVDPAVAGLLGCGIMAGLGAAINTGGVTRGDSVAVIGCGGVGDAAIAGAAFAGAARVIAVDIDDRKLQTARRFGATHTVDASETDPVAAIRELTGGNGADVVIEAVGRPETYEQAFYARDLAGTVVLVGVPTPEMRLDLPLLDVFGRGGALKSSWYGDCLPSRDFPMLVDLHLQGRLDLAGFVTERIPLEGVEEAFTRMHHGDVLRSVVVDAAGRAAAVAPVAGVESLVTSGVFALDGGEWEVDNNVWIVGDDRHAIVIDPAHDHEAIARALGDRELMAIVCTHAHNDHVNAAAALADLSDPPVPIMLHPDDSVLWHQTYPEREPDGPLVHDERLQVGGVELQVLHTPGHAPGAVCLYAPGLGALFSGDTLFQGGPGATGRSFSDFPTIVGSIKDHLFALPDETVVYTGHGPSTTIGAERPHLAEWIERGH